MVRRQKGRKTVEGKVPVRKAKEKSDERKVNFNFYAPEAREVYLVGDFNRWDTRSLPMKQNKKGEWKVGITLPPGRYEYKLVVDGMWVHDVPSAERVPNLFGTHNCASTSSNDHSANAGRSWAQLTPLG